MKLIVKIISLLVLLSLASPVIFITGCGNILNGRGSGRCPDSVAPDGFTITAPTIAGAPSAASGSCYSLAFKVTDAAGASANGICVVITTNAAIALTTTNDSNCNNAIATPQSSIVTRTDDQGNVIVDLVTPPTTAGTTFSVQVASGSLSVVATTPAAI